MAKKNISSIVITLSFLVMIFLPGAVSLVIEDRKVSKVEKRTLASLPEFNWSSDTLSSIGGEFETYFNDHFGFRSQIVRLHHYVMAVFFKSSPARGVTVGRDGWFFYNSDNTLRDYLGETHFSRLDLAKYQQTLLDREQWLNSIGTKYFFLPLPNKSSVYGDFMPERIQKRAGVTKYEQLTDYLKENDKFHPWLDSRRILTAGKEDLQVYFKTDSHWNHDGTYLVYRELIDYLSTWFPEFSPMEQQQEKKWVENFSGDLSIIMNLRGIVTERAPDVNVVAACPPVDYKRLRSMRKIRPYRRVETRKLPVVSGCDQKERTVIVISDSFGRFMRQLLPSHFKQVIFVHSFDFNGIKRLIEEIKPDLVLEIKVSRQIQNTLRQGGELTSWSSKNIFSALDDENIVLNNSEVKEALVTGKGLRVPENNEDNLWRVGDEMRVPEIHFAEGENLGPMVLELDITASRKSFFSLFYQVDKMPRFVRRLKEDYTLKKGRQRLYVRIMHPDAIGAIRLIAKKKGKYTLNSISIKKLH